MAGKSPRGMELRQQYQLCHPPEARFNGVNDVIAARSPSVAVARKAAFMPPVRPFPAFLPSFQKMVRGTQVELKLD